MNAHQQATSTPGGEREGLRVAMSWLHTWAGLVLGWLLFAIFLTGTLALFKTEIGLWMRPEMHGLPRVDAPAADFARSRAAALSMVPTTTSAQRLLDQVLPEIAGRRVDDPIGHLDLG